MPENARVKLDLAPRSFKPDSSLEPIYWVNQTNTSDDVITQIEAATSYLAEAHTKVPPKRVLAEALKLHQQTQAILQGGKQRLRQTRELLRIDSDLMAHACVLLGDLGWDAKAMEYGTAALIFAREAGTSEAIAWSAQAKTARWQKRYVESAELARKGFEASPPTPTRVELAYREANAIALFGDASRARSALRRAELAAESLSTKDSSATVWSFSTERQAVFALSVAIHTGDPDSALCAVATADAGWAAGNPKVLATWAQIRVGAGIVHLMKGSLDGAAEQVNPIFELSPELRIGTVIGYLENLYRRLSKPSFANDKIANELRQRIREFTSHGPLK